MLCWVLTGTLTRYRQGRRAVSENFQRDIHETSDAILNKEFREWRTYPWRRWGPKWPEDGSKGEPGMRRQRTCSPGILVTHRVRIHAILRLRWVAEVTRLPRNSANTGCRRCFSMRIVCDTGLLVAIPIADPALWHERFDWCGTMYSRDIAGWASLLSLMFLSFHIGSGFYLLLLQDAFPWLSIAFPFVVRWPDLRHFPTSISLGLYH